MADFEGPCSESESNEKEEKEGEESESESEYDPGEEEEQEECDEFEEIFQKNASKAKEENLPSKIFEFLNEKFVGFSDGLLPPMRTKRDIVNILKEAIDQFNEHFCERELESKRAEEKKQRKKRKIVVEEEKVEEEKVEEEKVEEENVEEEKVEEENVEKEDLR